jgi:hypothetical protein
MQLAAGESEDRLMAQGLQSRQLQGLLYGVRVALLPPGEKPERG